MARMNEEPRQQGKINVFLLDDHEILRRGVRELLSAEPDIDVIGEAGTAASALARLPALRPDVAVLDVRLPDGDGVAVCREIRSKLPETACLMLTAYGDDRALLGAIMAGAAGYVSKQTCGADLVIAVRAVASGQSTLDPQASRQVMARLRQSHGRRGPGGGTVRAGEAGPGADRRRADQSPDRGAHVPCGKDRKKLCVRTANQAWHAPPFTGCGLVARLGNRKD